MTPTRRRAPDIDRLRHLLSLAEAANGVGGAAGVLLPLGIPAIDNVLGGGFSLNALHEIAAARESEIAGATWFTLAMAARCRQLRACAQRNPEESSKAGRAALSPMPPGRAVLWIAEDLSLAENGMPYGPGLDEAGIFPEQLIRVATPHGREVLWAMEEAMRCRAVGVVIGELRASHIDQVAMRRLSLAAAAGNTLGLILRTTPDPAPSPAGTRWVIGAASSPSPASNRERRDIGPPRMLARLVRNRRGLPGAWIVEWNSVEQRFELASYFEPMAHAPLDRSNCSAVA